MLFAHSGVQGWESWSRGYTRKAYMHPGLRKFCGKTLVSAETDEKTLNVTMLSQ